MAWSILASFVGAGRSARVRGLTAVVIGLWVLICGVGISRGQSGVLYSRDFSEPIPANGDGHAWMEPAYLYVEDSAVIEDIHVTLDITHPCVADLAIYLTSPEGTRVTLKEHWVDWRNPSADMVATVFDDDAELAMPYGQAPYAGRFSPTLPLSMCRGEQGQGPWRLDIYDAVYQDAGTLDRWALEISHAPEPMLAWLLAAGGVLARRRRYGRAA